VQALVNDTQGTVRKAAQRSGLKRTQGCRSGYPVRSCIFVGPHTPSSPNTGPSNWIPGETWKCLSQF